MEKQMNEILPILGVEQDCILSKQGDYSVVLEVKKPDIFTLSTDDYATLHQNFIKSIKVLPVGSVFHMQDWFIRSSVQANAEGTEQSFLSQASERYFQGRPYLRHECYIFLTKKPRDRKSGTSATSTLLRKSIVPQETLNTQEIQEFMESVGQFCRILADGGYIKLRRLTATEILSSPKRSGIIERYCFLTEDPDKPIIRDIAFDKNIQIGDLHCQLYTLADVQDLPGLCGPRMDYDKYSTDKTKFPLGFAATLGLLLPVNHIYNQYIFIEDGRATMKKMETKRRRLQSLANYSRENTIAMDATNAFLNEAIGEQRTAVRAHFNVLAWTEDHEELKDLKNNVSSALAQMEATPRQETVGAPQIFWAGVPGNAGDFPMNDTFDTFLEQATCFLQQETNYHSAAPGEGIRFSDRLSGRPVYVDLFDGPRREGITSNMGMLVCGTSGGGKSMTVNHILRTLYDQGAHCVIVDIGGSYKSLCELVGGYYFTYEQTNPIRFNPFFIAAGDVLDSEKKESLKALLVALWKQENENFNRSEYVALSNALQGYYQVIEQKSDVFPCFNTFYDYLQNDYIHVLKDHKVKDRDFDVDNFLYVLRPYYEGGEFDYLLNARENLDLLNQQFVVVELDQIKDHPILFPVCTLILMELFISKMRKLQGKRKVLVIDEAWKAIAKSGMAEFLRYAFKTIRKFNGIPCVITQELDDLVSSPIIKDAIINNADIKILMDMRKFMNKFDKLQDVLGMSDKGKTILLSVNKDNREIYIDLGGQVMKVYKNELCPEEYYAYTTEGKERVKVMEYAEKYGSIRNGIEALVAEMKQKS